MIETFIKKNRDILKKATEKNGKNISDSFGMDLDYLAKIITIIEPFYKFYFRVSTFGVENIPNEGNFLFISNHSGQIPIDGVMIGLSLLFEKKSPILLRSMVERWVPELPFISTIFSKGGQILGTPKNAKRVLDENNSLLIFPEGVKGISKTFKNRYKLAEFGSGFARLAIETQTPIIPIAVIGAEEQIPTIANITNIANLLKIPAMPIPITPLPLPVKYRIYFGEPIYCIDNSEESTEKIKDIIQKMLDDGLKKREHIFW
ncbi:acyltransferase family protein [bacterium]|nr:acyltransferase family protein [bacterium]